MGSLCEVSCLFSSGEVQDGILGHRHETDDMGRRLTKAAMRQEALKARTAVMALSA
jgi:hypothetical protein